ncbi:acyl-CoA dehydrogenase [Cupriavidus necator]|uniref:Acyl-CoA dehydrogenase n=1 Tax=Cupriavidus necator TaxID=106590 RepID=A0A1U9UW66_CUPNE|nr:acyl-CoA dehydrogenase family protein [Cupriavidus necator]AQV96936.1 acyl-CoA dehydrogenase [Cupriavidus necator]
MNLIPNQDLEAFREEVRAFLREHLTPELRRGQRLTSAMYPEPGISGPWQQALQRKGWLVPLWPTQWGGTGWSPVQRFIFETECALAGAPLVHPMGVRLVGPVILKFGTEAQKQAHLPRILSGQDYWCQGFSEPGAGSDLAALRMRAEPDGDDYVLNGSKLWTTHAHHANRMFALVRTSTEGRRQDGISFLLIDMHSPGITVRPIDTIGGDHDVNEVFFDNVRVPQANRIGQENAGWACAKYLLEFERGAGIFSPRLRAQLKRVGDAMGALGERGLRRDADPLQVARFGEVCADLDAFEMLELKTLGRLAPGDSPGPVASILKLRASRLKQAIAELGIEVLGLESLRWRDAPGHALCAGEADDQTDGVTGAEVMGTLLPEFLNSRAYTIFGGAAEVQLGIIARSSLGL